MIYLSLVSEGSSFHKDEALGEVRFVIAFYRPCHQPLRQQPWKVLQK